MRLIKDILPDIFDQSLSFENNEIILSHPQKYHTFADEIREVFLIYPHNFKQFKSPLMENLSDEILWSLYLKGNKEALEQIYRRYYPLLLNYGCRLSANQDLVQDCIQNLFMKLMSKSRNLSDTPSVKGYLLKAFRNNLLDSLEKEEKQRDFIFIDEIPETHHITTEEESALKEDMSNLSLAYQELSAKQKEILYLFYIKGISHKEIANILNINYQSSKNRLSQSLVQLRKLFFLNKK